MKKGIPPPIYVLFAVLLWSTGGLFIKLTTLDAFEITFFRSLLAGITVLLLTYRKGLKIGLLGAFASVMYAGLLFLFVWATKQTTAANAIFLQYTAPIYILILGPFVIGEKFHIRDLISVIFCIGGMSLFFVGKLEITDYQGNFAALASGICLGVYILLLKHPRAGSKPSADAVLPPSAAQGEATAGGNPVITVIYGSFLLAVATLPSGIRAIPTLTITDAAAVAFLGIVQIGLAYMLFIRGVNAGTRPLDASIIGFIEPLLNPLWVFLFIGEEPSKWALLGGGIIIATVAGHTFVQYRSKETSEAAA